MLTSASFVDKVALKNYQVYLAMSDIVEGIFGNL